MGRKMSIKPISLFFDDELTVKDVISEFNNLAVVSIIENNVGHAYIGEEDIAAIDPDILNKKVLSSFTVKKSDGFHLSLEV